MYKNKFVIKNSISVASKYAFKDLKLDYKKILFFFLCKLQLKLHDLSAERNKKS